MAVRLAALLHDADDRKYFKVDNGQFPHAACIATDAGASDAVVAEMLKMIMLVSCSKNGNNVPNDITGQPEWLFLR